MVVRPDISTVVFVSHTMYPALEAKYGTRQTGDPAGDVGPAS